MQREIVRLGEKDFDELFDFLGLVFGQAYNIFDFAETFPKAYRRDETLMSFNLAMKINGRIRGNIAVFPMDLFIGKHKLCVFNVACVATHPSERGHGIMSTLLDESAKIVEEAAADFSCLGGDRQRYNYFGYEKAGINYRLTINKNNIRRKSYQSRKIQFEKIAPESTAALQWAHDLYHSQPVHINRDKNFGFYNTLKSYRQTPYIAYNEAHDMIGYLMATKNSMTLNEHFASSPQLLCDMICAWLEQSSVDSITVCLQPWETEACHLISQFCEQSDTTISYSYRVNNWIHVIKATLELKTAMTRLPDGEIIIEIEGYGKVLLSLSQNQVRCDFTDRAADLSMDRLLATRFFFGPLPPYMIHHLPERLAGFTQAVFPLPLSIRQYDRI